MPHTAQKQLEQLYKTTVDTTGKTHKPHIYPAYDTSCTRYGRPNHLTWLCRGQGRNVWRKMQSIS